MDNANEFANAVQKWDKSYHKIKKYDREISELRHKKMKSEVQKREAEKKIVEYLKEVNEWKIGTDNGVIKRTTSDKLTYQVSKK